MEYSTERVGLGLNTGAKVNLLNLAVSEDLFNFSTLVKLIADVSMHAISMFQIIADISAHKMAFWQS